nr:DNA mismatch repair protein MutS [uncultured Dyadobacter sp.]
MQPVDRHTLHELQILPENSRPASILSFYAYTETQGGAELLKVIITKCKATLADVLRFQDLLRTISVRPAAWLPNVPKVYAATAESYYALGVSHSMSQDVFKHWFDTWLYSIRNKAEFHRIQSGVLATLRVVRGLTAVLGSLGSADPPEEIADSISALRKFISAPTLARFMEKGDHSLSNASLFYLDYYFRISHREQFRQMLDILYYLDACQAIVKTARLHRLTFPVFTGHSKGFHAQSAWHPLIPDAVPNDFELTNDNPVCILTGANTSGKTTFLKTCGILVYLAHLGWPVPAHSLHLSFTDRLFTSIHLSDDLDLGYSHFFNEMIRIKQMAHSLREGETCFVIVDELFRGTNQEDALHCSETVIEGFAAHQGSFFLLSTHLHQLVTHYEHHPAIAFRCFKTRITAGHFDNTFRIEEGAAFEKVGRLIMDQTGVTALLQNANGRSMT